MPSSTITDAQTLISALGGVTQAARFFGEAPQTVWNWGDRKQFPRGKFVQHTEALKGAGIVASEAIWGQAPASSGAAL